MQLFNDTNNWFPWQKELYQYIFTQTGEVKSGPPEILWIVDKKGNSGKSSFLKFLYYHYAKEVITFTYTNASQLKKSILDFGPKNLYLIDLSHLNERNVDEIELLSVIQEINNGVIIFSHTNQLNLFMNTPYVVLFSSFISSQDSFVA